MKLSKKLASIGLAVAMVASIGATSVFAGINSKPVTGYGTLSGEITNSGVQKTEVSYNNDKAKLVVASSVVNQYGATVVNYGTVTSNAGDVFVCGEFVSTLPSTSYAIYGTHGVQGGSIYSSDAIYTYTKLS